MITASVTVRQNLPKIGATDVTYRAELEIRTGIVKVYTNIDEGAILAAGEWVNDDFMVHSVATNQWAPTWWFSSMPLRVRERVFTTLSAAMRLAMMVHVLP